MKMITVLSLMSGFVLLTDSSQAASTLTSTSTGNPKPPQAAIHTDPGELVCEYSSEPSLSDNSKDQAGIIRFIKRCWRRIRGTDGRITTAPARVTDDVIDRLQREFNQDQLRDLIHCKNELGQRTFDSCDALIAAGVACFVNDQYNHGISAIILELLQASFRRMCESLGIQ
jgi:hypothetical protein